MKNVFLLCIMYVLSSAAFGCTTFVLKNDSSLLFGRNLDWYSDDGVAVVNKRNVQKEALVFPPEQSTTWTSKYGSVTFNQFGKEFPFGGMNERGLVVELMVVPGQFPALDNRTAVNELQWVQYQLDNCASIEEVIATDSKIRIQMISQNLHYLVCDSSGNAVVIEFTLSGMKVYRDEKLPIVVLENDPYQTSLKKRKLKQECRFLTASNMLSVLSPKTNTKESIRYSFDVLDKVKLDGSWSMVYDIKAKSIHFITGSNPIRRLIQMNSFDFSCQSASLLYDLARRDAGNVLTKFISYSRQLNVLKFKAGLKSNGIRLPSKILQRFLNYTSRCK